MRRESDSGREVRLLTRRRAIPASRAAFLCHPFLPSEP